MPRTDEDRLKYLEQFSGPEAGTPPQRTDEDRLKYLESVIKPAPDGQPETSTSLSPEETAKRVVDTAGSPSIRAGVIGGFSKLASLGARGIGMVRQGKGWDATADWYSGYSSALGQEAAKFREQPSPDHPYAQAAYETTSEGLEGALTSAPAMAAGAPAGPYGMIAVEVASASNDAITEGRKAGLKGGELASYAARQGAIEGAIDAGFQIAGFGGVKKLIGSKAVVRSAARQALADQAAATTGKGFARKVARTFTEEDISEIATNLGQRLNDKYSGVDARDITLQSLAEDAYKTTATVAWTTGFASSAHITGSPKVSKSALMQQEIVNTALADKTPTRKQWKEWGLDPEKGKTAEGRVQGVREAALELTAQQQATETPQEPTQQAVTEAVTEPALQPESRLESQPETAAALSDLSPGKFQDMNQEQIVHGNDPEVEPFRKGNSFRYVLEGTGDVFREMAKGYKDSVYIKEKLRRLKRFIDSRESLAHEDTDTFSKEQNPKAMQKMRLLWEKQPTDGSDGQLLSVELNKAILDGDYKQALMLHDAILSRLPELTKYVPKTRNVSTSQPAIEPATAEAQQTAETPLEPSTPGGVVLPEAQQTAPSDIPPDLLGIKNQLVEEFRTARGESPLQTAAPEDVDEWLNEATEILNKDRNYATRLVSELNAEPRPISNIETSAILVQYRGLKNDFSAAELERQEAYKSGDPLAIKDAETKAQYLLAQIQATEEAAHTAGTEWGRGGVARKLVLRRDFSREALISRASVAKKGLLTASESATIAELSAKVTAIEAKLSTVMEAKESQDSETGVTAAIEQAKPKKRFQKRETSLQKIEAQQHVKDAWKKFQEALASTPKENIVTGESGTLNLNAVEAGAKLAKAYADLGITTLAEFLESSRVFVGDVAGVTTDTLRASWRQAQVAGWVPKQTIDPTDNKSIRKNAKQLMRALVENGITERDAVVDGVHEELRQAIPDITRRQVMDALSGYGQFKMQTQDEAGATISDINGQLRQLSKLEDLEKGIAPVKGESRVLSKAHKDLIRKVREAMRREGLDTVDINKRLESYKERLTNKLADLQRRSKEGDFSKPVKTETPLDKAATDLKWQVKQEMDKYKALEEKWRKEQLKGIDKAWDVAGETANFSHAIMASFDLSMIGKQAASAAKAHPLYAKEALGQALNAWASKASEFATAEKLRNHPLAQLGRAAKLAITVTEGQITQQEEAFRGKIAAKVPGVAGSERAYVTFLNSMRMNMFAGMVRSLGGPDSISMPEVKAIANAINVFTGRGYFSRSNGSLAQALATYLFSPRFLVARFQFLVGQPMWRGTARTRWLIAKEYGRALAGHMALKTVLYVAGYLMADDDKEKPITELNPLSSEFGKTRMGDYIVDDMGGLTKAITLMSRLTTGYTKRATGDVVPIRGEGRPINGMTAVGAAGQFLRTSGGPMTSLALNTLQQEDPVGQKTGFLKGVWTASHPMIADEIWDTMQAKGFDRKVLYTALAFSGLSTQKYAGATPSQFAERITEHPKLAGFNKKTKKEFDYSEGVDQVIAQAKKRGLTLEDMTPALIEKMREDGDGSKAISDAVRRLNARYK